MTDETLGEPKREMKYNLFDLAKRTFARKIDASYTIGGYEELITAIDAALDWADANARWFDISTAPTKNGVGFHAISYDREGVLAYHVIRHEDEYFFVDLDPCDITEFSHWRPLPPPPSNPPLPEPLERLGDVVRMIKGA